MLLIQHVFKYERQLQQRWRCGTMLCTNDRPAYITYSKNTCRLNMKLWVIRKDENNVPNLVT